MATLTRKKKRDTKKRDAVDRLYDAVVDCFTPEVAAKIAALRADAETQARLDDLADRHGEGLLSEAELAEYDDLVRTGTMIAIIQAMARKKIRGSAGR